MSRAGEIGRAERDRADGPTVLLTVATLLRAPWPFGRAVARGAAARRCALWPFDRGVARVPAPGPRTGALMERPTCLGLGTARADGAVRRAGCAEADRSGAIRIRFRLAPRSGRVAGDWERGAGVAGRRGEPLREAPPATFARAVRPISFTLLSFDMAVAFHKSSLAVSGQRLSA